MRQANHLTVRSIGRQDIRSHSTDILCQRHHQFLTNRVDSGIRDLRELLTEIVEEHLRTVADHGQWCVITHRGHWFLSCCRHRHNCLVDIFLAEAEVHEFLVEIADGVVNVATALQFLQLHAVLTQPCTIRMSLCQLLLDLAVVVDLAFLRINQQNLSWLQTTFRNHIAWFEVHHANLGCDNHHTLFRNRITAGAQTVSVEHSACIATIAEQERGRTVPRLHQDRMVLVEGFQILADGVLVVEALRHQDGHCLRQ